MSLNWPKSLYGVTPEQAIYVRPLRGVHCPVSGASEFSCCLSNGFLLVSIPVPLAYVGQDFLFYICQFHSFQGTYRKELWSKENNILIVGGSISVISSPQQCIWFAYCTSGAVMKQEVKPS